MLLAPGQQIEFYAAFFQIVEHLVSGAGRRGQFVQVIQVEIGHAPAADLAGFAQALERCDGFLQGILATPVQQVHINVVGTQPLQTALARLGDAGAAGVVRVHLADQKHLVAPARDGFTHHLLGTAFAVHFSGVDQGHAQLDALAQRRHLLAAP
ncbi:hypothetical protein D3C84_888290 [compost metagenome]